MRRILIPVLLGALVLTACGGDDDEPAAAPSAGTTAPADDADTTAPARPADAPPFCDRYDEVLGRSDDPLAAAETPGDAAEELRDAAGDISGVADEAPEDIEQEFTAVADASVASLTSLADLLESEHGEVLLPLFRENVSPETIPDDAPEEEVAARDAALEWVADAEARYDEQLVAASQQVTAWYGTNCQTT